MLTLDVSSGIQLEYLGEGAANVVYKIIPLPPSPSTSADADFDEYDPPPTEIAAPPIDPGLQGKLVRLRKAASSNVLVSESYKHYETTIVPLFPQAEDRVEHILFKLTQALLEDLNQQLKVMESQQLRPKKRHSTYLAEDEDYGLLVTDMSCSTPSSVGYRFFEFKPKWLVQSPSAPTDAVRCRTCALRHLRKFQDRSASTTGAESDFCPLGLVSKDKAAVATTVHRICGLDSSTRTIIAEDETLKRQLIDFIYDNPLLKRLREMQYNLDRHGALDSDFCNSDFLTAMTLRDCTLFLKVGNPRAPHLDELTDFRSVEVSISGKENIEARLGDLDFKSPNKGKREYWRNLEAQLIDEGWYTAREKARVEIDSLCMLSSST